MRGMLLLHEAYGKARGKEAEARRAALEEEEEEEEEESKEGVEENGAGAAFADAPPEDEEEDVVDEEETAHAKMLAARKARADGEQTPADGEGDDDESLNDEPPAEETPLDHLSHPIHLQRAIHGLIGQPAAAAVLSGMPPNVAEGIRALSAEADALLRAGLTAGEFGMSPEERAGPLGGGGGAG